MDSDRRTAATEDDRVDVDGGRLQDRPDHVSGELVEGEQLALAGAQDERLLQNVSVLMCSKTPPEQRNHRHSAIERNAPYTIRFRPEGASRGRAAVRPGRDAD